MMDVGLIKDFAAIFTAFSGVLAAFFGLFKYFQYRTRRDKIAMVGEAFNSVVQALASDDEVERLAAAIRLRRFFDPKTELGIASTPYAGEAINVIAAVLRTQKSGTFQKLLADGLAYAPSLRRADLQRTNLENAYLGLRKTGKDEKGVATDLSYADFYRANLSGASFKGAKARGAVFYQARLHNTVLSGADLRDGNFFEADLLGANFDHAVLAGASFKEVRNVPPELAKRLDAKGVYPDERKKFLRFFWKANETKPVESIPDPQEAAPIRVFLSKSGVLNAQQRQLVDSVRGMLREQNMSCEMLERSEYPEFGAIGEVRRRMSSCAGVVIFGFHQLKIQDGVWCPGTAEEMQVRSMQLSTPWNQIEAGMAAMRGLPILLVCQRGMAGGIFDLEARDHLIHRIDLEEDQSAHSFQGSFANWCAAVREQARGG
jgi:Pentapeptide repeats (8 copies)